MASCRPRLTLEIVTPDRALVTEEVDEVGVPGLGRRLRRAARPYTASRVAAGGRDVVRTGPGEALPGRCAFGFVGSAARKGDRARANRRTRARTSTCTRAERAKHRAEERLAPSAAAASDMDFERARIAMMKSLIRLPGRRRAPAARRAAAGLRPRRVSASRRRARQSPTTFFATARSSRASSPAS